MQLLSYHKVELPRFVHVRDDSRCLQHDYVNMHLSAQVRLLACPKSRNWYSIDYLPDMEPAEHSNHESATWVGVREDLLMMASSV